MYFGYSRKDKKARVVVKFSEDDVHQLEYAKVNHYLAEKLLVYIGRDIRNPNFYSGKIALVKVLLGKGAFQTGNDFEKDTEADGIYLNFY